LISSQERRIWQEIERRYAAEMEEPALPELRPPHWRRLEGRGADDLPAAVVSGVWVSIVLILCGFVLAGLAVGAATTLAALLWRYWPMVRVRRRPRGAAPSEGVEVATSPAEVVRPADAVHRPTSGQRPTGQ
jgi:hypothetical protein